MMAIKSSVVSISTNRLERFPPRDFYVSTGYNSCGEGYARALIEFIVNNYREQYAILQVGTGDSPLTIPFYEKCGFVRSHIISNFFTDNYDHPIYESGMQLADMVYLTRSAIMQKNI